MRMAPRESDAAAVEAVRRGDLSAYGRLYQRHVTAAYRMARQLTSSPVDADDLVAEAFVNVLDALLAGDGPRSAFRAYLLTTVRHLAYTRTRRLRGVELTPDVSTVAGVRAEAVSICFTDPVQAGLERAAASAAFAGLSPRWQRVLWRTEIEGHTPAQVAAELGLTPNGVAALAYRARARLRSAYLQALLRSADVDQPCAPTFDLLGAWTGGALSPGHTAAVTDHLGTCEVCRRRVHELADTDPGLTGRSAEGRAALG